jgi:hypothetical protein
VITAGAILEFGSDAEMDIRANRMELNAGSFGAADPIEISTSTLIHRIGGTSRTRNFSGGTVRVLDMTGGGQVFFEQNGGADLILDRVSVGGGSLELFVRNSGKLFVDQFRAGGRVLLRADDMDFTGGLNSISGPGTISLGVNTADFLLVVNPFDDLLDQPGILTLDQTDIFALDFSTEVFLGNVELILPVATLGDTQLLFSSGSEFAGESVEPLFIPFGLFGTSGQMEDLFALSGGSFDSSTFTSFLQEFGFSIYAVADRASELEQLLTNAGIPREQWLEWFQQQTGFSVSALSGFGSDFFRSLRIRLPDGTVMNSFDSTTTVAETHPGALEPVWSATTSEFDERELVVEGGWRDALASARFALESLSVRVLQAFCS